MQFRPFLVQKHMYGEYEGGGIRLYGRETQAIIPHINIQEKGGKRDFAICSDISMDEGRQIRHELTFKPGRVLELCFSPSTANGFLYFF